MTETAATYEASPLATAHPLDRARRYEAQAEAYQVAKGLIAGKTPEQAREALQAVIAECHEMAQAARRELDCG